VKKLKQITKAENHRQTKFVGFEAIVMWENCGGNYARFI